MIKNGLKGKRPYTDKGRTVQGCLREAATKKLRPKKRCACEFCRPKPTPKMPKSTAPPTTDVARAIAWKLKRLLESGPLPPLLLRSQAKVTSWVNDGGGQQVVNLHLSFPISPKAAKRQVRVLQDPLPFEDALASLFRGLVISDDIELPEL